MKITLVQYDGDGEWIDVHFDDGRGFRISASALRSITKPPKPPREAAVVAIYKKDVRRIS